MIFLKPKFWDKKKNPSLISILLWPISLIVVIKNYYENSKIKKNYYDLRTICVGNIYIGGTGKTPLVNNLANHFKKRFPNHSQIIMKNNKDPQSIPKIIKKTKRSQIIPKSSKKKS